MTRKIKALGLSLVAVAVMSMAAAASVHAFEMHVTSSSTSVITGQQTQQFVLTTSAGTVVCTTANFEGRVVGQGGQQITNQHSTLTPTLSGCTAFGLAATVKPNGCKFTITNKNAGGSTTAKTGYVDIAGCTAGKTLEVNAGFGGCIFTAGEQANVSHVVFSNETKEGIPHDVLASVTLTGIAYEFHGGLCGHPTTVVTNNGSTNGQATIRTYVEAATSQVTEHGHQFNKSQEGQQVGILAT
jgi:hypothetical protein